MPEDVFRVVSSEQKERFRIHSAEDVKCSSFSSTVGAGFGCDCHLQFGAEMISVACGTGYGRSKMSCTYHIWEMGVVQGYRV